MTACQTALKFKIKWMNDTYSTSLSLCSGGVLKSEKLIMLCIYIQEIDCCRVFSFTTFLLGTPAEDCTTKHWAKPLPNFKKHWFSYLKHSAKPLPNSSSTKHSARQFSCCNFWASISVWFFLIWHVHKLLIPWFSNLIDLFFWFFLRFFSDYRFDVSKLEPVVAKVCNVVYWKSLSWIC